MADLGPNCLLRLSASPKMSTTRRERVSRQTFFSDAQRLINNNDEIIVNAKEILQKLEDSKNITCIIERNDDIEKTGKVV